MRTLPQLILLAAISNGVNASITGIDEKGIEDDYKQQIGTTGQSLPVDNTTSSVQQYSPINSANSSTVKYLPISSANSSLQSVPVNTAYGGPVSATQPLPVSIANIEQSLPVNGTNMAPLPVNTTQQLPVNTTQQLPVDNTQQLPVNNTNTAPWPVDGANNSPPPITQLPQQNQSILGRSDPSQSSSEPAPPQITAKKEEGFLGRMISKIDPTTVKTGLKVAGLMGGALLLHKLAKDHHHGSSRDDEYDETNHYGGYYGHAEMPMEQYSPMPMQSYEPMPAQQYAPMPVPIQQYAQQPQINMPQKAPMYQAAPAYQPPPPYTQAQPSQQLQLPQQPQQVHQFRQFQQAQPFQQAPYFQQDAHFRQDPLQAPQGIQCRPYSDMGEALRYIQKAVSAQMKSFKNASQQSPASEETANELNPLNPRQRTPGVKSMDQVIDEIGKRKGPFSFPQIFLSNFGEDTLPPPRGLRPIARN